MAVGADTSMWAQLALTDPNQAAAVLAAAGVRPGGGSFAGDPYLPGGGASAAPTAAGAGPDQKNIMAGLSGAAAATQQQLPRAQYIPPAPLPRAGGSNINPSQAIAQIAPLLLGQLSNPNLPSLGQLIRGA